MLEALQSISQLARQFTREAHVILARHEASSSRVILLDETKKSLSNLSLKQLALFSESIACAERGLYRSAHVMAWAGFVDFLEQKMASDGLAKVRKACPEWSKYGSIEELREHVPESQIVEAAKAIGLLSKSEERTIQGLLSKRNECAHPSDCNPSLNETVGYISDLLSRIERIQSKVF